ncbi:hypothetical protein CUMW_274460 [Citrus unshiu]|uniref:non-specific serine/threonine protein kinase n=1 Tax=Citrus unshiu TaxID=55188 RepID=A0A2H5MY95_CITUN|nr:hypothetical protein CUMW_274460 [Citrus unshiu]
MAIDFQTWSLSPQQAKLGIYCGKAGSFCGNFTGIGYPFWRNDQPDYCGHPGIKLDCQGERATIDINSQKYDIIEIYHDTQILKIAKADFMLNICPVSFINSILEFNLFEYTFSDQNASLLYNYDHLTEDHQPRLQEFTCPINNWSSNCYFTAPAISSNDEFSSRCKISLLIPVLAFAVERFTIYLWNFDQVIKEGFEVKWIIDQGPCNDCLISRGKCGYNRTINDFTCFCPYQPSPRTCSRTQPPANSVAANPSTVPGDGDVDEQFMSCNSFHSCGDLQDIGYPFWGNNIRPQYCGRQGFELQCHDNDYATKLIGHQSFRVLEINNPTMRIVIADYVGRDCLESIRKSSISDPLFNYTEKVRNLSLFYDCSGDSSSQLGKNKYNCTSEGGVVIRSFYTIDNYKDSRLHNLSNSCSSVIKVPIQLTRPNIGYLEEGKLIEALNQGFEMGFLLNWTAHSCSNCEASGGRCGFSNNEFVCFCQDRPHLKACDDGGGANLKLKVGIGVGAAFGGMGIMAAIFLIYLRRKKNKHSASTLLFRNTSSEPSSKVDLENGGNYHGVQVFSYGELEEATNYFDSARELGDGGFGTVYYGELQDGRAVAVKRLYENNYKRVEQFMNEVDILARLRHKNLVSLYGCTSRHSRELLLVYEFISNGTVADHLHGERAKPGALPWPTRLKIAIETASALTYLHASDIIHRDVKTNNILLDNNFCVKVADFGLSRLFPNHVTHVSTAPQGTPGYVDPEYHQCYQLTDKSDVFSFGVVLIELISSMPAVDITRHRHEINLSNLAINKIQNKALHELVDQTLGYESDNKVRRTINAVAELAFQCLQSEKDLRPYMVDVLDALRDIESDGYDDKKTHEEMMTQSPDSVTLSWTSTKTTPTSSS